MGVKPVEISKGSGRWYVRVNYQKLRKSKYIGTEQEARDVADQVRIALKLYGIDAIKMLESSAKAGKVMPTVKKYSERWLEEIDRSDLKLSTRKMYRSNLLHHILPNLGNLLVSEVDYATLKSFILEKSQATYSTGRFRKKKYKAKPTDRIYSRDSLRIMAMTLRALMAEAVREGLIPGNPVKDLATFYKKRRQDREVTRSQVYTLEELYGIEDKLKNRTLYGDHYELSLLLSRTGMRIGEAMAIRESDIDWAEKEIHITRNIPSGTGQLENSPKTEAGGRAISMSEELINVIKDHIARKRVSGLKAGKRKSEPLFSSRYEDFFKSWKRAQEQAGVRYRSPHSVRHTYASQMLAAGSDIAWLSNQLGHSSPKVTLEIYSHFIPGRKPQGVNALDRGKTENANKMQIRAKIKKK